MTIVAADVPGGLSIVVQGPLFQAQAPAIAVNLARWRALYPRAQIVCAISSTDCFEYDANGGAIGELTPALDVAPAVAAAARAIAAACDLIVFSPAAAVRPPIKTDSPGPNHVNLQIAAARAGLALADGRHVLRVRNDLTFADRRLLVLHGAARRIPRGARLVFAERIMVSQLFTLNPLTAQRMPFHVSDWFHLGLIGDVARLWNAAVPATAESATWYSDHPHAAGSNAAERRFLTRLASEQRITFPVFGEAFPDLSLDYHNDTASAAASLRAIADNFAIANMAECGAVLPKYQRDIDQMSTFTRLECLSQDQLERIAATPDKSVRDIMAQEVAAITRHNGRWARIRRSTRRWSRRVAGLVVTRR